MDFANLDWADGQVSIPGIANIVVAIPKSDIVTWPTLVAVPTTASEDVTYVGSFVLVAEKTWKRINCVDAKSPVTCETQGETRSQTFLNKFTIKTTLTTEGATSWAKRANNSDLVYLAQEKNSRKWRLIGNDMFNTLTKPSLAIGGEATSERGVSLDISVTDPTPAPFYIGAIVTDSGDLNPV
jgi:hypothetical protein